MDDTPPGLGSVLWLPPPRGVLGPHEVLGTPRGRGCLLVFPNQSSSPCVLPKICQCVDVILPFQKSGNVLGTLQNPKILHEEK